MQSAAARGQVIETRQGEYLLLEAVLPGREAQTVGLLLYDPEQNKLGFRLRRDWDEVADTEDAEVLSQVGDQLKRQIEEEGPTATLEFLEERLSNVLRLSQRRQVLLGNFLTTLTQLYERHVRPVAQPFRTHLPLYSLRAAAGKFGEQREVEPEGWVQAPERMGLREGMFVAQVVGRSMEPQIPEGSYCVFRAPVVGSRQGRWVLVENYGESEAGGQRYTIKRYRSEKEAAPDDEEGQWRHRRIWLEPLNPEFEAWDLVEGSQCKVLAEYVGVLD